MVSRIEILGRFPTKENLFRFIKAYYKMFSKKLEITLNNFDEDLINSYVGSYWKFWASLANSIGMNKDDVRQFFFIMNCIAENIENLDNGTITLDNFEVPEIQTFELEVVVTIWESEFGTYDIDYEGYMTKEQLEINYDELIPDWSYPFDWDYEYTDTEQDESDTDIRRLRKIKSFPIYE